MWIHYSCFSRRSLCLSTNEAFEQGKSLPFINPSSLETLRALVQEIQSSGETDPEMWKDCEVGKYHTAWKPIVIANCESHADGVERGGETFKSTNTQSTQQRAAADLFRHRMWLKRQETENWCAPARQITLRSSLDLLFDILEKKHVR